MSKRKDINTGQAVGAACPSDYIFSKPRFTHANSNGLDTLPYCDKHQRWFDISDGTAVCLGCQGRAKLKCPNCRKQASAAHFRDNPECAKAARSVCGMVSVAQRKQAKAGPGRGHTKQRT